MKKIFVDTNIIVDLIADRAPFSKFAIDLFSKAEKKEVLLFTSSHSIATTHYLLKKYIEERELRNILFELITLLKRTICLPQSMSKINIFTFLTKNGFLNNLTYAKNSYHR